MADFCVSIVMIRDSSVFPIVNCANKRGRGGRELAEMLEERRVELSNAINNSVANVRSRRSRNSFTRLCAAKAGKRLSYLATSLFGPWNSD